MKKLLSTMLILALAVTCLASCGGDDAETTVANTDAATQAPATTEAPADETEAPADETEAPADETDAPADETEAPSDETEAPADSDVDTSKALAYWSFKTEDELFETSWGVAGGALELTHKDGAACIELNDDDAQFNLNYIEDLISVDDIANITIKVKNACTTPEDDKKGQIFFTTTELGGHAEECSVFFDYTTIGEDADWQIVEISDFSSLTGWSGELTGIRFDVSNHGTDGFVYVEYIIINGK